MKTRLVLAAVVIFVLASIFIPGWFGYNWAHPQAAPAATTVVCNDPQGVAFQTAQINGVEVVCNPHGDSYRWEPSNHANSQSASPALTVPVTNTVQTIDDVLNPCKDGENPDLQIEPLTENGKVVPHAFMGLDLNRKEVTSGKRYKVLVPAGSYIHLFVAVNDENRDGDHLTYEGHGAGDLENGTLMVSTAWTIWCQAGNYNPKLAGQVRVMNAKALPEPLEDVWMKVPENGIMPVPDKAAPAAANPTQKASATGNDTSAPTGCTAPKGWTKNTDGSYHIGPLAADNALTFTVPTGMTLHYSFEGIGKDPASAGKKVTLHEGTLFCNSN